MTVALTGGGAAVATAGSTDAVMAVGAGDGTEDGVGAGAGAEVAVWPGGAQPGGGTKALLGSPKRTGAAATAMG